MKKKIIDDFLEEAAKLKGKALNKKEKQTVKFIARYQVRSIRKEQKSKKQRPIDNKSIWLKILSLVECFIVL